MDEIRALARELGFSEAYLTDASPTKPPEGAVHPQAAGLVDDPTDILPGARSVLVLVKAYRPYRASGHEAEIDAYYPASNMAHEGAEKMAEALEKAGVRAKATYRLRMKVICARAGIGFMGRNGLIAVGDYGSRVSLQTIVTDLPAEIQSDREKSLDDRCLHCAACVRACPTGALMGDGRLDVTRCLRAQPESDPLPEEMRPLIGGSILGCDICQRVCPRNARVPETDMPEDMARSLRLDRLLMGEYKGLISYLGANNARKKRLMNRAALAAANMKRYDLVKQLEALSGEDGALGEHAAWAVKALISDNHNV